MTDAMLQSPQIRKVIDTTARSTNGVHNINSAELAALVIPCPELIEQLEIVRRIETAFAWLDLVAAGHATGTRLLPKLDQAILTKAFRGKLVPQSAAILSDSSAITAVAVAEVAVGDTVAAATGRCTESGGGRRDS